MNKSKKGITLIALVITVIVLLILAGVTISLSINSENIFDKTSSAREEWDASVEEEQQGLNSATSVLNQWFPKELISKDTTINNGKGYVGYYADFDGIPGIDGIIYADLLTRYPTSNWYNSNGSYTLPTTVNETNVKDYYISNEPVVDVRFENANADPSTYTARYVISSANNGNGTEKRFYAMGLEDIVATDTNRTLMKWYYNAYGHLDSNSDNVNQKRRFGMGKTNTDDIIALWNSSAWGAQGNADIWKWVQVKRTEYSEWFVPSIGEWSAFAVALNISKTSTSPNYYRNRGLDYKYWSSSLSKGSIYNVWNADFSNGYAATINVNTDIPLRLSATF